MRFSDILRNLRSVFERKRKNPIQLERDSNLEPNLKFLKVDTKSTPIQISEDSVNINGSLTVNNVDVSTEPDDDTGVITALNNATANEIVTVGATTTELDAEANLTFDGDDLALAATGKVYFDGGGNTYITETASDILDFYVGATHLIRLFEGVANYIELNNADVTIDATEKLFFDGSAVGNTYITESASDIFDIYVGGDNMLKLSEKGDDGNEVSFGSSCVGFTQLEPTYDATNTVVDFRHSNKQNLTFGAGNITNLSFYFPLVSGNFQLLIKQDGTGSRTVTNYKVYEFDETVADGEIAVKFAGGSNPTLTTDANHVDIISFYWDADNEIAYGVATLDFQF